jgi:multidrug resistance efflux pump
MIKNLVALAAAATTAACSSRDLTEERYQGMIEQEETHLGFEVAGRLVQLRVHPGQIVAAGELLATLDDALDRGELAIRAQEVAVAQSELALIAAGSRQEDVRAARAQLAAAVANEATVTKQLARERELISRGAVAAAHLDDLDAQLAQTRSQRQTLEERVRVLTKGAREEELTRERGRVA